VVGAGYIAVEMAQILHSLGSNVTLIIRHDAVLRCTKINFSFANLLLQGEKLLVSDTS
jgi:pyruvate/2-oxoglutarate dehydrogenase complex dihydrolipoamide dehydrogenase (E3) component